MIGRSFGYRRRAEDAIAMSGGIAPIKRDGDADRSLLVGLHQPGPIEKTKFQNNGLTTNDREPVVAALDS